MRFLFDESVELRVAHTLSEQGHDVSIIGIQYPAALDDPAVLDIALREQRTLVTNDTDFGELAFRRGYAHAGIILIRLPKSSTQEKAVRLLAAIDAHADALNDFIVVVPQGIRIRR